MLFKIFFFPAKDCSGIECRQFVVTHNELIYSVIVESSLHILNIAYLCI